MLVPTVFSFLFGEKKEPQRSTNLEMLFYLVFELIPPPSGQYIKHFVAQSGFLSSLTKALRTLQYQDFSRTEFIRVRWPIVISFSTFLKNFLQGTLFECRPEYLSSVLILDTQIKNTYK